MNNWNLLLIGTTVFLAIFFMLVDKFKHRWQGMDSNLHGGYKSFNRDTVIGIVYALIAFSYLYLTMKEMVPFGNLIFIITIVLILLFAWNVGQFFVYLKGDKRHLGVTIIEVFELILSGAPVFIILWVLTGLAF